MDDVTEAVTALEEDPSINVFQITAATAAITAADLILCGMLLLLPQQTLSTTTNTS